MSTKTKKKVTLNLTKIDSNAFSLMGHFQRAAKREKWTEEEIDAVLEECQSGDYDHLVATLVEHTTWDEEDDEE